jgi:hypothetical protein
LIFEIETPDFFFKRIIQRQQQLLARMQRVHVRVTNRPNRQQRRGDSGEIPIALERERERETCYYHSLAGRGLLACLCVFFFPFCSFDSFYVHQSCGFFWCSVVGRSVGWALLFLCCCLFLLWIMRSGWTMLAYKQLALFVFSFLLYFLAVVAAVRPLRLPASTLPHV